MLDVIAQPEEPVEFDVDEDPLLPHEELEHRSVGDFCLERETSIGELDDRLQVASLARDDGNDASPLVRAACRYRHVLVDAAQLEQPQRALTRLRPSVAPETRKDEEIEREIRDEVILKTLWVNPTRVKVQVEDGYVTLEGRVDNEGVAEQIVHFVQLVPGVVSIEPRLTWPRTRAPRAVGKTLA